MVRRLLRAAQQTTAQQATQGVLRVERVKRASPPQGPPWRATGGETIAIYARICPKTKYLVEQSAFIFLCWVSTQQRSREEIILDSGYLTVVVTSRIRTYQVSCLCLILHTPLCIPLQESLTAPGAVDTSPATCFCTLPVRHGRKNREHNSILACVASWNAWLAVQR